MPSDISLLKDEEAMCPGRSKKIPIHAQQRTNVHRQKVSFSANKMLPLLQPKHVSRIRGPDASESKDFAFYYARVKDFEGTTATNGQEKTICRSHFDGLLQSTIISPVYPISHNLENHLMQTAD
jgi:hypothetical protein